MKIISPSDSNKKDSESKEVEIRLQKNIFFWLMSIYPIGLFFSCLIIIFVPAINSFLLGWLLGTISSRIILFILSKFNLYKKLYKRII